MNEAPIQAEGPTIGAEAQPDTRPVPEVILAELETLDFLEAIGDFEEAYAENEELRAEVDTWTRIFWETWCGMVGAVPDRLALVPPWDELSEERKRSIRATVSFVTRFGIAHGRRLANHEWQTNLQRLAAERVEKKPETAAKVAKAVSKAKRKAQRKARAKSRRKR